MEVETVTNAAKGITDYGALAMMAAAYLSISLLMMVAIFKWFKSIINNILQNNSQDMKELLNETRSQNNVLNEIADGMRPTTLMQIKSISNTCFDLSVERVCRLIKKIREENHIIDKEATQAKIRTLLCNLHEDRNSRFDNFNYSGHTLTYYTNPSWVDWVAEIVEKEVYEKDPNHGRAFTNVEAVYAKIKLDFYNRIKQ